tara:strand:- start:2413 stop:3408 length:996 start_codon:yes stop_codon:yes gene_type:complete
MNLDFLSDIKIGAAVIPTKKRAVTNKRPSDMNLRVYKNGAIHVSAELAKVGGLEFLDQVELAIEGGTKLVTPGNGVNIFKGSDWIQYPNDAQDVMFLAFIPREGNKPANLYGSGKYNAEGKAQRDVANATKGAFGVELKEMLTSIYSVDWEKTDYVDFTFNHELAMQSPDGTYAFPRKVVKGSKEGTVEHVAYTNASVVPVVVTEVKLSVVVAMPSAPPVKEVCDTKASLVESPKVEVSDEDMVVEAAIAENRGHRGTLHIYEEEPLSPKEAPSSVPFDTTENDAVMQNEDYEHEPEGRDAYEEDLERASIAGDVGVEPQLGGVNAGSLLG